MEERTHITNPTSSLYQSDELVDIHLKHLARQGYTAFCVDCAWACYRLNKSFGGCR
ncbi:unnamed protein product, partial [Eruca vesicaria subsp. sativa]|nr:unnamed protein product [Eruca vesicaria subsp. sativa]